MSEQIVEFLSELRELGVQLRIEHETLKANAPAGVLNDDLRAKIVQHKTDLIAHIKALEQKPLPSVLVQLKPGNKTPLFVLSGHGGDVFYMLGMARNLDKEQPVFGIRPPGLDGEAEPLRTVAELARYELDQIRQYQPKGPYLLAGHCAGGILAFEAAQQLIDAGEQVNLLALIGCPIPKSLGWVAQKRHWASTQMLALWSRSMLERYQYIKERIEKRLIGHSEISPKREYVERTTVKACRAYRPQYYDGHIDVFMTADRWHRADKWAKFSHNLHWHHIDGYDIDELLLGPNVNILADKLQAVLNKVNA